MGISHRLAAYTLLAIIAISALMSLNLHALSDSSKYVIIVLPNSIPSDPKVGNCVIELLKELNLLAGNGSIKAFWLLDSLVVNGLEVPAGSIAISGGSRSTINEIIELASSCGLKVLEVSKVPSIRAILIKPPRIAVLNPGFQPTLLTVLKQLGFNYDLITNSSIMDLLKGKYDLLILPPGSGTRLCKELGPGGAKVVAKFVANGGGLIGVCAGAYAPVKGYNEPTSWLEIVSLKVKNYPTWALGGGIVYIKIAAPNNPVMFGFKGIVKAIYWNGPILIPYDLDNHTTLGIEAPKPQPLAIFLYPSNDTKEFIAGWGKLSWKYVYNVMHGGYAVVFARYGMGKIVLFSIHPEIVVGPEDTPKAVLKSRYNWRMLWQAIYFVSGSKVVLGKIVGIWIWPSALRYTYQLVLKTEYKGEKLSLAEKKKAFVEACDLLAKELASYGVTDAFLQVKLLSGTLIYPSKVGKEYGVPNPYPAEPYNITNVVAVCAKEMHKYGIRLHAWIIVWYDEFWGRKAPMYHCGKWLSKTSYKPPYPVRSRVDLFYVPYQKYIVALAKELVSMGVDGVHLDYIRWPHAVYSFGPIDFKIAKRYGIDLAHVERVVIETFYGLPNESKSANPQLLFDLVKSKKDPNVVKWIELRREAVLNITRNVAKAVKEVNPKAIVSAALLPDAVFREVSYEVRNALTGKTIYGRVPGNVWQLAMYGQVYSDFAKLGYWLMPMAYHREYGRSVEWVGEVARYFSKIARDYGTKAVIGIQAYGGVTYDELLEAERLAMESGANGYCIFNIHSFLPLAYRAQLSTYGSKLKNLEETAKELQDMAKKFNLTNDFVKLSREVKEVEEALKGIPWLWISPASLYSELYYTCLKVTKDVATKMYLEFAKVASEALSKNPALRPVVTSVNSSVYSCYESIISSEDLEKALKELSELRNLISSSKAILYAYSLRPTTRTVTVVYTPSTKTLTITLTKVFVTTVTKQLPVRTVTVSVTKLVKTSMVSTVTISPQTVTKTLITTVTKEYVRVSNALLAACILAIVLSIASITIAIYVKRSK